MNDFYDSTASRCVALVDKYAPALMIAPGGISKAMRASCIRSGLILSIEPPMKASEVTTAVKGKCEGEPGIGHPDNVTAFKEIMALGENIVRGDITNIARKHRAHVGTVQKMVHNAKGRPPRVKKEKQA